jgi:hypothetical protein
LEFGMELSLGHFGDRRLEKGGPIYWAVLSRLGAVLYVFGGLAVIVRGRFA